MIWKKVLGAKGTLPQSVLLVLARREKDGGGAIGARWDSRGVVDGMRYEVRGTRGKQMNLASGTVDGCAK